MKYERSGEHPAMEEQLHTEFRELRRMVNLDEREWWFKTRANQILDRSDPAHTFQFFEGWFTGFKNRYKISLRRPTNTAQNHLMIKKGLL